MANLETLRNEIDEIDRQILSLFEKRMNTVKQVSSYKMAHHLPVLHKERERQVIENGIKQVNRENQNNARILLETLMQLSRWSQQEQLYQTHSQVNEILKQINSNTPLPQNPVIACQGVKGSYSWLAAKQKFPNGNIQMSQVFSQVFDKVLNGEVDFGILPIENSNTGSVGEVYQLMREHEFYINFDIKLKIQHCLAARPETALEDVQAVYSHSQALAQCSQYINRHHFKRVAWNNTASAAQFVSSSNRPIAAICSKESAKVYGLSVLEDNIQCNNQNYTRFIVISKRLYLRTDCDTIATALTLPHSAGTLHKLLARFSFCQINLKKIESRPIGTKEFDVIFYLDFSGNIHNPETIRIINDLYTELDDFTFLGNYKQDE